jgi:two-component system, OmpR family, sensor histidine kinase ChvG
MEHEAALNAIRKGLHRSSIAARLAMRGIRIRNRSDRAVDGAEDAKPAEPARRVVSPLTRRILAVNVVALLIPIGGLLYVGPYRDSLIDADLESLRSQGEMIAGAIGESAIEITPTGGQFIDLEPARHIVRRLSAASRIRSRLFLTSGEMAADSSRLLGGRWVVQVQELPPPRESNWLLDWVIDSIDVAVGWLSYGEKLEPYTERGDQRAGDYPEVQRAFTGEIIGVVRAGGTSGYVLTVAIPVQRYRQVIGVLLLSKDGIEIEASVRAIRLTVLAVFAGAMLATILLSLYLARTIAQPVLRLAAAAERIRRSSRSQQQQIPDFTGRGDEIGELSGVLREMTDALHQRMDAIERFAADVSHEIKNPLTSLRSAVETAARVRDPQQLQRLMAVIEEDVQRLDRLITDISNASRLDAELSRAESEPVDIGSMLHALADMYETTRLPNGPLLKVQVQTDGKLRVSGVEDRLVQVIRNLIANAQSFSPPNGTILLKASRTNGYVEVQVEDEGPGIPESKMTAIFDRFYTERPKGEKFGTHSGLGLSISKQIVEAHRGTVRAMNRYAEDDPKTVLGARFIVRLPVK